MWGAQQPFQSKDDFEDESGYYAALNLPRDASQEDVHASFRRAASDFSDEEHATLEKDLRQPSKGSFAFAHEANRVLSDVKSRQIYDVYGKQGLEAGMELGESLRDPKDFRREFEDFRQRTEQQRLEDGTIHKGHYLCRVDASELIRGTSAPLFRAILIQNSIDFPLTARDSVHIQGQAALRNHQGAGNVIMGYKRQVSKVDSFEASAVVGLKTILSASSTLKFDSYSSATVSSTREITKSTRGTLSWVIGPSAASGMSLQLQRRGDRHILAGKVEVGLTTAISARISYAIAESMSVRAQVRLGTTGVDLELGANKRFSPEQVGYLGTVFGMQGVLVKLKYVRGGQTFELPISISQRYDDWRVVAAAYILPQLTFLAASRLIFRPLASWSRRRTEQQSQKELSADIWAHLKSAEVEQSLVAPLAKRKAESEAKKKGLVLLDAVYGVLDTYKTQQQQEWLKLEQQQNAPPEGSEVTASGNTSSTSSTDPASSATLQQEGGDSGSDDPKSPPLQWLRVVLAMQYQVVDGRLILYKGPSKAGLMGFTDPAPHVTSGKQLYVAYMHGGAVYETCVDDTEQLELPISGASPVPDPEKVKLLIKMGEHVLGTQLVSS
eukprot:gene16635-22884_t